MTKNFSLFFRAYITATRQCVAQANSWSLEELILDIYIGNPGDWIFCMHFYEKELSARFFS